MKRLVFLNFIVLLTFIIFFSGCVRFEPQFPSVDEIRSLFDGVLQPQKVEVKTINLFIDGSESMGGFILGSSNTYKKVLQRMYLNLRPEAPVKVYKFGERIAEFENRDFQRSIQDRYFYNEPSTYLDSVISRFISPTLTSSLAIIITDGIQSRRIEGYNLSALIDCLAKRVEGGWYIELIGFKSDFDGIVYSELDQTIRFRYRGKRPFYLFIFSPNLEKINLIKDIFRREGISFNSFRINSPFGSYTTKYINDHSIFSLWEQKGNVIYLEYSPKNPKDRENDVINLKHKLDFNFRVDNVFRFPLEFEVNVKGKKSGDKNLLEESYLPVLYGYKSQGKVSYVFTYNLKKPKSSGYYNYKIEYFPKFTSLLAPAWVKEWSTDDDTKYENCNKTLYLYELFNLLARTIICKQKLAEVYISIYFGGER